MPRGGEVHVGGVRSPTIEAGPEGASEAAVFVHGNPGSTHDWARLVAATGEHGRAVALDMPGFGDADKPEDFDYTVEGYSAHLAGALDALGVDRVHLVVHDFGGPWGLHWATEHPDQFASITIVNTGVLLDYRWHLVARLWRRRGVGEALFRLTTRSSYRRIMRRGQPRPLPEEQLERMWRAMKDPATQRAVLQLYRSSPPERVVELQEPLRALDRPALVAWGVHDPFIPPEQAERQRETFPRAQVVRFEDAGHWPMWDVPEELERAVVPFLAEQLAAGVSAR